MQDALDIIEFGVLDPRPVEELSRADNGLTGRQITELAIRQSVERQERGDGGCVKDVPWHS